MSVSRDNYTSMVRLAQALYESGAGPHGVLHQCYGIEFPKEFFVIAEADRDQRDSLLGWLPLLPWELAITLNHFGPAHVLKTYNDDIEREIFARDPDLIPLVLCRSSVSHFVWGFTGSCLCYRLSELAGGRTTIFRTHSSYSNVDPHGAPDEIVRCGDSLLAALHQHHTDDLAGIEWASRASAHQSGGGWADDDDVTVAQSVLADLEEMQRRVTENS